MQALTLVPQIEIAVRPEAAQQLGVTSATVRDTVATMLRGTKVGELFDQQKVFDVVVWGTPARRARHLRAAPPAAGAARRRLRAARIGRRHRASTPTPNEITREGGSRRIDVTTNVRGRDLGSVARDIQAAIAGVPFDTGLSP